MEVWKRMILILLLSTTILASADLHPLNLDLHPPPSGQGVTHQDGGGIRPVSYDADSLKRVSTEGGELQPLRDARRLKDGDGDGRRLLINAALPIRLSQAEAARRLKARPVKVFAEQQEVEHNEKNGVTSTSTPDPLSEYVLVKIRRQPLYQHPPGFLVMPMPQQQPPAKGLFQNIGNFFGQTLPIEINIPDMFTQMAGFFTRLPIINRWQTQQQTRPRIVFMPNGQIHPASFYNPDTYTMYNMQSPYRNYMLQREYLRHPTPEELYQEYSDPEDSVQDEYYRNARPWGYPGRAMFQKPPNTQAKNPGQENREEQE